MLNNRGWGIQAMMVFIMVLMISLVVSYIIAQKTFSNFTSSKYQNNEKQVISALKKYKKENSLNISSGEEIIITIKKMKNFGLLKNFDKCTGYGLYKIDNDKSIYKAYIKCGSQYITDGYLSYLDEV